MEFLEILKQIQSNMTPAAFFPLFIIFLLFLFFVYYFRSFQPQKGTVDWIYAEINKPRITLLLRRFTMEKRDIIPLSVIISVFLLLAVFNLGHTNPVDVISEINVPTVGRTHLDNLYFDEIFFVRTAAEHIHNINPYEISHPPLGKLIISASILLFGESPLGWRLIGAIFGVLMLAVMYIFVKNMFGKTMVAVCCALLFGFDFMRFVQTRIGTIDTYAVLFILLAFFFMYRYITTDKDAQFKKSLAPLALSGLFFGLSFAVKWIGFYAGAGLLVFYVIRLFQLGNHYLSENKPGYGKYLLKTVFFSLIFFVIIPVFIYYLTYIPYGLARGMTLSDGMLWDPAFVRLVWGNQFSMFNYHNNLVATHPFSSTWWQWIFNIRPILYVNNASNTLRATFGAFGNPVVWWGGIVAMIIMTTRIFTHRDGKALFILIGYLSQLLPWVAVTRIVFAYHYFPSVLFLILALAHIFNTLSEQKDKLYSYTVYGYTIVSGLIFVIFFPALSGMYLPGWYYSSLIRWFPSWPF